MERNFQAFYNKFQIKHFILDQIGSDVVMSHTSLIDLPNEIIEKSLLVHLGCKDVTALGMVGIKRFEQIVSRVMKKRRKSKHQKIISMLQYLYN